MTPLDLSKAPPQAPRAMLAGVVFLPRSIDKLRATLPGGDLGPYTIHGFTDQMLDRLGIGVDAITAVVAGAATEAEVGEFVRGATTPAKVEEWNAYAMAREPRGGDRVAAREIYPWIDETPDLRLVVDVLAEDDRRYFAARG